MDERNAFERPARRVCGARQHAQRGKRRVRARIDDEASLSREARTLSRVRGQMRIGKLDDEISAGSHRASARRRW